MIYLMKFLKLYVIPISVLAYADHLVLVSRPAKGLQLLLDKAGLAPTILGLILKPTRCATLTLNCKGGTKVINYDYVTQNNKLPSLKREKPYRYLGVPIGIDVDQHEATEICEQLIIDIDKLENSIYVGPLAKTRCHQNILATQTLLYPQNWGS